MQYGLLLAKDGNDNALAFLAALTEVLPFDIRQFLWVQQPFRWQLSGERELPLLAHSSPSIRIPQIKPNKKGRSIDRPFLTSN